MPDAKPTPWGASCANVPLKEHLDGRIDWLQAIVEARMDASDKAVEQAAEKLDVRLTHSNDLAAKTQEWMRDARSSMVLRVEHAALVERVHELSERLNEHATMAKGRRAGVEPIVAIGFLVIGALIAGIVTKLL